MSVMYRNNRLAPAIIITACLWLSYMLLNTSSIRSPGVEKTVTLVPLVSGKSQESLLDTPAAVTHPDDDEPAIASSGSREAANRKGTLSPEDVLLIVKTGGTTLYKRLLIHLATTFAPKRIPLQNTVIYSDCPDNVGSFQVIDVLVNTTSRTLNSTEFDVYRSQGEYRANNVYLEAAGLEGDDWGPQGGWVIDKYKFIPLVQHAGENWPAVKWYIYTEDDTYLFLPNVLKYLAQFDHHEAHWLGSYAAKSDVVFAQGGAGFALSRGAWEKSFGQDPHMAEKYESYTAEHCCGDQVLGHALNKYGIKLGENGGDEVFRYGFNPLVHWAFPFERWSWCLPLYSWHKVHARDAARYYTFEQSWNNTDPFTHGHFFKQIIAPELRNKQEWWDNMSSKFKVTSASKDDPPIPASVKTVGIWKDAWLSADACAAACTTWDECIQWSFAEDLCKMDDKAIWGKGYASEMSQRKSALMTTSGWMVDRIQDWDTYCFVKP